LNSLIQTQLLKNKKLFACFVDLSQAFDSPGHNRLWKVLLSLGVSQKWVRVFAYIYEAANARVQTPEGLSDPIKIMKGVLQGESASPSIFNLFLEEIVSRLEKAKVEGFRLHSLVVHILMYADDMVIVAPSPETLQMKLKVAANFLSERGLSVNMGKTKVVVFGRSGRRSRKNKFYWMDQLIEIVSTYTYLGVTFSSTGVFKVAALEFAKKGLAAQGAIAPPESLLYQSFVALRRVSLLLPNAKFSWYLQLRAALTRVKEEATLDKGSANYLYFFRERVVRKHRWSLGEQDLDLARKSTTIPHYHKLVSSIFAEPYLMTALPQYIVTCVAQLRLNYSIIFNQGSWHDLGMFEIRGCKFCEERDSFTHLFTCSHYKQLRLKLLSPDPDFEVMTVIEKTIDPEVYKNVYFFINSALKLRSI
jgi:hypothetical protein